MLDHAWVVDEEDAVVDMLEQAGVPLEREPLALDFPVEPAHPDRSFERGDEVVAVDRLRHEVVRSAAERPDGEIMLAVAGDQERRRAGPDLDDRLEQGEAVHPGHLDVGHDRVVVDLLDPLEGVRRGLRRVDLDALHAQEDRLGKRLEQRDVVIHEQDPRALHRSRSSVTSSPIMGISTVKVAPPPGVLESEISPPCSLTML